MADTGRLEIFHNPRCSKSRAALAIIEAADVEFDIVPYLDDPPTAAQRPGDNRLRFTFSGAAVPADVDPQHSSGDRRPLAAAFYTLVAGPSSDASIDDLLARDAPRPFAVGEEKGVPCGNR